MQGSHLKKYLAEDLVSKLRTGKTSPNNILGCTEICRVRIGLLHISEKVKDADPESQSLPVSPRQAKSYQVAVVL